MMAMMAIPLLRAQNLQKHVSQEAGLVHGKALAQVCSEDGHVRHQIQESVHYIAQRQQHQCAVQASLWRGA